MIKLIPLYFPHYVGLFFQIFVSYQWFVVMNLYNHPILLIQSQDNDMVSRKDAVMQNIRQELALANAQELMNVWAFNTHSVQQSID